MQLKMKVMPSDNSLDVFYLNGALICFCFYNTVPEVKRVSLIKIPIRDNRKYEFLVCSSFLTGN